MKTSMDAEPQPGEQASEWLFKLQEGDAEVRSQFFAWLRQSPRHVEEFLFATATWETLHRFGQYHPLKVEQLLAAAALEIERGDNVVPLQRTSVVESAKAARRRPQRRIWIAAAGVSALALGIALTLIVGGGHTYSTAKGEQRIIRLEDGSIVHLNTDSRLKVRFSKTGRDLRLLNGEALFTVQHDRARPFRVRSDGTLIQAVGTQFNVYRRPAGTRVSVLEGTVRITAEASRELRLMSRPSKAAEPLTPLMLAAGGQADAGTTGQLVIQPAPDIARAVAWQDLRVIFKSERLEDAAAEVNRYSPRPFRVEGELKDMRISAIFDANDPEALLRFLRAFEGVAVETRRDEVIIRPTPLTPH